MFNSLGAIIVSYIASFCIHFPETQNEEFRNFLSSTSPRPRTVLNLIYEVENFPLTLQSVHLKFDCTPRDPAEN